MSNINRKLRNLYIAKWAQTNFADYQVSETINFLPEAQKFSFKNLTEEKPSSLEVCNNRNEEGKKISIKLYERTDVVRFRLVKGYSRNDRGKELNIKIVPCIVSEKPSSFENYDSTEQRENIISENEYKETMELGEATELDSQDANISEYSGNTVLEEETDQQDIPEHQNKTEILFANLLKYVFCVIYKVIMAWSFQRGFLVVFFPTLIISLIDRYCIY
ncbi:uncharacterized protein LOC109605518 [Aethina tumida]|uniref:uncharacterized protein LOC109605518 n=1 Tax=Aethina tumida TaxID=116153 RepID=UPI00096B23A2|nr:uncharacterized protein LOC109605518 [Aethina tumida]